MSTESEVVSVTIEVGDASVSSTGFGVPLIAATHTFWAERVRTFESPSDLTRAPYNVPTTHPIYLKARALKAQQPAPAQFKVGKRTGAAIAVDLDAIRGADDDWYALITDATSPADIAAVAAWAETTRVLHFALTSDAAVADGSVVSGDIGTTLQTASYDRTALLYHPTVAQAAEAAWVGKVLPKSIGSATWANKALSGVDKSTLDASQRQALTLRNVNYYIPIKTVGFTLHGLTSSGRFIDIQQGIDWFDVRVQERIIGVLANNDKIPYTDNGLELLRAQVEGQILEGITARLIDGDQPYAATVPLRTAISAADQIARTVPRLGFSFTLQGAVHKVRIEGKVLVAAAA